MLRLVGAVLFSTFLCVVSLGAAFAQDPIRDVMQGCSMEINIYCNKVKPGGGRLLACAKNYEDKLSPKCIYAINRATFWIDILDRSLKYISGQCENDARKFCGHIRITDAHILSCLDNNRKELNYYCRIAVEDTDLGFEFDLNR